MKEPTLTEQQMYEIYREDRIRQVKTTKERHGQDHYAKIGAMKKKRTFDNPEMAKKAANARWDEYRKEQERLKDANPS